MRARSMVLSLVLGVLGCTHASRGRSTTPGDTPPRAAMGAVEIHWDRHQVPHVLAEDRAGVAYGYGWAQLRAYPEELLRLYAGARGEGALHWGQRYRTSDRMVRTLGLPTHANEALEASSPELREELEAFARGMNDYARAHPEQIPEQARGVLPIRATDPLAHGHRILLSFALLTGQRPLVVTVDGEVVPWVAGSNMWAIGPSRSASGHPLLLANPHLPWGPAALRMFEAHLQGPDAPLYGVALLGFPVVMIGFNDAIAWTHTVNVVDTADLYALVPDGEGYRFDGRTRAFEEHSETVRVRQEDGTVLDEPLRIRRSVHGPVIELTDGQRLAVKTGMDDLGSGWLAAWSAMGRARGLEEFEAVLRTRRMPMFTVGYADRDGHVLYLSAGRIPRREEGDFLHWWQAPLPGDTSATLWDELLPYEALPRVVDPASGFVQNSNSVPWLATWPSPFPAPRAATMPPSWPLSLREVHGLRLLLGDDSITFDELRAMQHSSRIELADHVLDELVLVALAHGRGPTRWAGEVLAAWDRQATAGSRGAVLFAAWARRAMSHAGPLHVEPWSEDDPLRTQSGLADPETALRDLEEAAREVWAAHGTLDPPWGAVNRLRDDVPGVGASGDPLGSFYVVDYEPGPDGTGRPVAGDTFVAIVELRPEGPRAEVLLSYGNASPTGPYAGDDFELMAAGRLRRPLLQRAEIEAEAIESVRLEPIAR
jgi:acyl-homoserine-lactone acylase